MECQPGALSLQDNRGRVPSDGQGKVFRASCVSLGVYCGERSKAIANPLDSGESHESQPSIHIPVSTTFLVLLAAVRFLLLFLLCCVTHPDKITKALAFPDTLGTLELAHALPPLQQRGL